MCFIEPGKAIKKGFVLVEQNGFEDEFGLFVLHHEGDKLEFCGPRKTGQANLIKMGAETSPEVPAPNVLNP